MNMLSVLTAVQVLIINRLLEISPLLRAPDLQNHYHSFSALNFPLENKFLPENSSSHLRLNVEL